MSHCPSPESTWGAVLLCITLYPLSSCRRGSHLNVEVDFRRPFSGLLGGQFYDIQKAQNQRWAKFGRKECHIQRVGANQRLFDRSVVYLWLRGCQFVTSDLLSPRNFTSCVCIIILDFLQKLIVEMGTLKCPEVDKHVPVFPHPSRWKNELMNQWVRQQSRGRGSRQRKLHSWKPGRWEHGYSGNC